jgi:methylenetetrahydrofolate reductase (NADPH)
MSSVNGESGDSFYPNRIRDGLQAGDFVCTIEVVPPSTREISLAETLKPFMGLAEQVRAEPRIAGLSVADRIHSDDDHDAIDFAIRLAEVSGKQPLIHWAGKKRELLDLHDAIGRMREAGLANLLLLTGDRVKSEPPDRKVHYLESVPAIMAAKRAWPTVTIAAAVTPFKYREAELVNQYLKLGKKCNAGADYIITQIGYDMAKFRELAWWCAGRGYSVPLVANLMPVMAARGRYIRAKRLPGVVITDDFQALLEEDDAIRDQGWTRAMTRLALQMVALKRMGYAGVQFTMIHVWKTIVEVMERFAALDRTLGDDEAWLEAWNDALRFADGRIAEVAPAGDFTLFTEDDNAFSLTPLTPVPAPVLSEQEKPPPEIDRYRWLDRFDRWFFRKGSFGARLLGPAVARLRPGSIAERALLGLEKLTKKPSVGCETCGFCRLGDTFYVCPETCPKGLANGPCGGTDNDVCEFGGHECVHNQIYRLAKNMGRLDALENLLIPTVPDGQRGTCSWPPHFRGEGPRAERVKDRMDPKGS